MTPAPASRERTLRLAALAGDEGAWAELFRSAFDTVYRYAVWRCGGRADVADDVTQEAWVIAAGKLRAFDPARGPFAGWVCGLAANAARNAVRARLRYARTLAAVPAAVEPEQDGERVAVALAELPPEYEAVLRAKYFEERSVIDIAAATGRTPKAVESLLSRAREAFRAAYQRTEGPG